MRQKHPFPNFRRVRFSGRLKDPKLTLEHTKPIGQSWFIDFIKDTKESNWRIFKTFNWDSIGPNWHYTEAFPHLQFKRLREIREWLFIEQL